MMTAAIILFCLLGIVGAGCVLISLFSLAIGALEKDRKKISFGGKILLVGIGILFVWFLILINALSGWHC
jgi:hypothetical protein